MDWGDITNPRMFPANAPAWAGVGGLLKLFGRPAARLLAAAERGRLAARIARLVTGQGTVVAFERDAFEGLRDQLPVARSGSLAHRPLGRPTRGCSAGS